MIFDPPYCRQPLPLSPQTARLDLDGLLKYLARLTKCFSFNSEGKVSDFATPIVILNASHRKSRATSRIGGLMHGVLRAITKAIKIKV